MLARSIAAVVTLHIGGCVTPSYSELEAGTFSGTVLVMWVDEGGSSGDGKFLFVPDPKDRLLFKRSDSSRPGAIVKPELMYTDGGSIPKIAQVFKGLSPWGYAPAYMIHDWLFVARHCLLDGRKDPHFAALSDVTFEESAKILGESIKTLVAARRVQPNDLAGSAITTAVDSSIARKLWDVRDACESSTVSPLHAAAAEAAVPGSTKLAARRRPDGTVQAPIRPASLVARIKF